MSDLPLHIEQKLKAVERKAQVPGATLSRLSGDIEEALRASLNWWLKEHLEEKLTQADEQQDRKGDPIRDDTESEES
jgi:hypothetical protein